jgi:hypothetical protein
MIPSRLYEKTLVVVAVALALTACASSGPTRDSPPTRDLDVITQEDIEKELGGDLYVMVSRLRPQWMRSRGDRTFVGPVEVSLIVDGVPWANNLERLREIRTVDVLEVRYLSASDATTQYGPDMAGGAILVFTRRGG